MTKKTESEVRFEALCDAAGSGVCLPSSRAIGLTATDNTTISAVAVLGHNLDGSLRLDVFHNTHAKNRLDPDLMRAAQVRHWRLPGGARSSLVEWQPL